MASITSWTRIEPRARHDDIKVGLQARLYDPLWMLGRQVQLGELNGSWGGSPIVAKMEGEAAPLSRYHPGSLLSAQAPIEAVQKRAVEIARARGANEPATSDWLQAKPERGGLQASMQQASADYSPTSQPLQLVSEAEPVTLGRTLLARLRIEIGQQFLRFLEEQNAHAAVQSFLDAYPLVPGPESPAADDEEGEFLQLMARGVPDGGALWEAITLSLGQPTPTLPPTPPVPANIHTNVLNAAKSWRTWCLHLVSSGSPVQAWVNERLEYQFAVSARMTDGTDVTLEAAQHPGGTVDWDAFAARPGASLGNPPSVGTPPQPVASTPIDAAAIPSAVTFPGMPAFRFWEFEDGNVNLAAVWAGPEDLARLALLEFGLIYGNDWFLVPLQVPVGSAVRLASLRVTDTFGKTLTIEHYSEADAKNGAPGVWRMFRISETDGVSQAGIPQTLFLPPIVGVVAEGDPVEEVTFQRDDMAAMGWAIEAIVEGESGRPLRRQEAYQRRRQAPSPPPPGELAYRMVTEVPDYWIPLVPVPAPTSHNPAAIRLDRGAMLDPSGHVLALPALGRILDPAHELKLYDEEVPRDGVVVTRAFWSTRWVDGSPLLWSSRRKRTRRPEKPSGLRFDVAE